MEQTALRPKPMPGREPGAGAVHGHARHPHVDVRRRGRRLTAALRVLPVALVVLLAGIGLGTVGAAAIGLSGLAGSPRPTAAHGAPPPGPGTAAARPAPVRPTVGLEAVDDGGAGARVVGVHVPGPGYSAGLVRGDVLLSFGGTRIGSAADLARAVARARPGREVALAVRHRSGAHQRLTLIPGVVT
ncbi:PDZ domain-containing protein [Streptomyces sp. NPDC015220]|uniref:PDZ domain-containing protein n=1 Tax=Streptomyces sp. NPDC015220 TaxID=3364947 RepID=UPI0036F4DDC3